MQSAEIWKGSGAWLGLEENFCLVKKNFQSSSTFPALDGWSMFLWTTRTPTCVQNAGWQAVFYWQIWQFCCWQISFLTGLMRKLVFSKLTCFCPKLSFNRSAFSDQSIKKRRIVHPWSLCQQAGDTEGSKVHPDHHHTCISVSGS